MTHTPVSHSLLGLARSFKRLNVADPLTQCLAPRLSSRQYAVASSQVPLSETAAEAAQMNFDAADASSSGSKGSPVPHLSSSATTPNAFTLETPILKTLYSWPSLEPSRYAWYGPQYLDAPMRRDLLHRAVVFEADATRQGTASTKWRFDVHGSNRKLHAQKGTGKARVRDRKSPIRRGGGVAFGPKPRDFSTELQRKVYYQAFKVALSYRHRKGELVVLDNRISLPGDNSARFLNNVFEANSWGKENGRSLLVTRTGEAEDPDIFDQMRAVGEHGALKDIEDVDVKDLLETGRVVIEKMALFDLLSKHLGLMDGEQQNVERQKIVQYL